LLLLFTAATGSAHASDLALRGPKIYPSPLSFERILASLTTNPAQKFGYGDRTCRIVKGLDADLVVLAADPTTDPTAFSKVRYTIPSEHITHCAK